MRIVSVLESAALHREMGLARERGETEIASSPKSETLSGGLAPEAADDTEKRDLQRFLLGVIGFDGQGTKQFAVGGVGA